MKAPREWKHLLLLVMLVAATIFQSFTHRMILGPIVADALAAVVVIAVFAIVFQRGRERFIAFVALTVALAASWAHYMVPTGESQVPLRLVYDGVLALFLSFAVAVILRDIFQQKAIRTDDVLGAVCGYLIAAGAWARLYGFTYALVPGSFAVSTSLAVDLSSWHGRAAMFDYFSLVTLTTMGYGDVTPVLAPATAFATLEAVFGQFYIAVVVAQLVGARLAQAVESRGPTQD
jgi:hypothetical protein